MYPNETNLTVPSFERFLNNEYWSRYKTNLSHEGYNFRLAISQIRPLNFVHHLRRISRALVCPWILTYLELSQARTSTQSVPHTSPNVNTMQWPLWLSRSGRDGDDKKRPVSWTDSLNATDWRHYTDPRTIVPTILLTATILASVRIYRSYLRRIPEATYIQPGFFRRRSLFGTVTRVGDGDGFHLFHTPGGRLAGWGWLRKIPEKKSLKGKTVCIS